MSKIEVDKIDPQSGTALEVGTSGDTVTVPSGVGLTLTDSTLLLPTTINTDKIDPKSGTALEIGTSGDTITVPTGAGLTVTDEVKTNKISPATGTAFTLGDSGDTFTVPSGATISNLGTATGFGGNTPGFQAYLSASQTGITQNTWVKAEIDTEVYDSDGTYDNSSNYRFTPAVAGKYFVFGQIYFTSPGERFYDIYLSIYKNGSSLIEDTFDSTDSGNITQSRGVFGIVDLGASDYVELFGKGVTIGSANVSFIGSAKYDTHFGGFKVG